MAKYAEGKREKQTSDLHLMEWNEGGRKAFSGVTLAWFVAWHGLTLLKFNKNLTKTVGEKKNQIQRECFLY